MPDENRFKPSPAPVGDQLELREGSALKGVTLGALVDLGGTLVFGVVVATVYAVMLATQGRNAQEIHTALTNSQANPWMTGISVVGGCAFSILGGYVCERVAKRASYHLGAILGCILATVGSAVTWSTYSVPMHTLLFVLTVGSTLLGTSLGWDRREL